LNERKQPGQDLDRRRLVVLGGASAASVALGTTLAPVEALAAKLTVPRRILGKTKQSIPILLLGGGSGFKGSFDARIQTALEYGVNYIDTARKYASGRSEPHAAITLHALKARSKTWITSKTDSRDAQGFARAVDETLREMKTSYVDLYFLHELVDPAPLDDKELLKTVDRLKKEGKIRYFGFSCHDGNVAELLHAAAARSYVDAVMFRYNFRQYGDKELNLAIDKAHKAGVGLIAMKTQGSEAGIADAWKRFEQTGKWNKFQSVLKAVWADERIAAAVSHMDDMTKLKENIAAALDRQKLGLLEEQSLRRYAAATRQYACDGCAHRCEPHVSGPRIAQTLRYLMYHDAYGERDHARALFQSLPSEARALVGTDFSAASRACPHGLDLEQYMRRAVEVLA
jgi:predicted aldo/keto reductase-like oxidoreductase